MKKIWEINGPTLEDSIRIALKKIQKFAESRALAPVRLNVWNEGAAQLTVAITFQPGDSVHMGDWINSERAHNV